MDKERNYESDVSDSWSLIDENVEKCDTKNSDKFSDGKAIQIDALTQTEDQKYSQRQVKKQESNAGSILKTDKSDVCLDEQNYIHLIECEFSDSDSIEILDLDENVRGTDTSEEEKEQENFENIENLIRSSCSNIIKKRKYSHNCVESSCSLNSSSSSQYLCKKENENENDWRVNVYRVNAMMTKKQCKHDFKDFLISILFSLFLGGLFFLCFNYLMGNILNTSLRDLEEINASFQFLKKENEKFLSGVIQFQQGLGFLNVPNTTEEEIFMNSSFTHQRILNHLSLIQNQIDIKKNSRSIIENFPSSYKFNSVGKADCAKEFVNLWSEFINMQNDIRFQMSLNLNKVKMELQKMIHLLDKTSHTNMVRGNNNKEIRSLNLLPIKEKDLIVIHANELNKPLNSCKNNIERERKSFVLSYQFPQPESYYIAMNNQSSRKRKEILQNIFKVKSKEAFANNLEKEGLYSNERRFTEKASNVSSVPNMNRKVQEKRSPETAKLKIFTVKRSRKDEKNGQRKRLKQKKKHLTRSFREGEKKAKSNVKKRKIHLENSSITNKKIEKQKGKIYRKEYTKKKISAGDSKLKSNSIKSFKIGKFLKSFPLNRTKKSLREKNFQTNRPIYSNRSESWVFKWAAGRDLFRRHETISDWQYERAKGRKEMRGAIFNLNWQFERGSAREKVRREDVSDEKVKRAEKGKNISHRQNS